MHAQFLPLSHKQAWALAADPKGGSFPVECPKLIGVVLAAGCLFLISSSPAVAWGPAFQLFKNWKVFVA